MEKLQLQAFTFVHENELLW